MTDRASTPRLVLGGAALGFAASLVATAVGLGRAPLVVIFAVLVVGGCCGPALTGGLTSQLPKVVSQEALPRAFGIDSLTYNVSGIVGPALVAVLSGLASPAAALSALGAICAIGAFVIAALPLEGRRSVASRNARPRLTGTVRLLVRDRVLGLVTVATTVGQAGLGALPVVVVALADRAHVPSASGWLLSAFGVGALAGSISWIVWPGSPRRAPVVVLAAQMLTGAPLCLVAVSPSLGCTVVLFALSGFFVGPLAGALFTTRQEHSPDNARAQVFTLGAGLKITAGAAGVMAAGALAETPAVTQLLLSAACPLLAGAVGVLLLRVGHTGGHAPPEPPSPGGARGDGRRRDGSRRSATRVGQ